MIFPMLLVKYPMQTVCHPLVNPILICLTSTKIPHDFHLIPQCFLVTVYKYKYKLIPRCGLPQISVGLFMFASLISWIYIHIWSYIYIHFPYRYKSYIYIYIHTYSIYNHIYIYIYKYMHTLIYTLYLFHNCGRNPWTCGVFFGSGQRLGLHLPPWHRCGLDLRTDEWWWLLEKDGPKWWTYGPFNLWIMGYQWISFMGLLNT